MYSQELPQHFLSILELICTLIPCIFKITKIARVRPVPFFNKYIYIPFIHELPQEIFQKLFINK